MHIECMSACSRHCDGDMYRRHWRCLASACSPACACARVDGGLCSATARLEADVDGIEKGEDRRELKTRVIAQGRAGLAFKAEIRVLVLCGLKVSLGQQQQEFILVAALLTARALAVSPCWFSSQSYGRWCRGSRLPCVTAPGLFLCRSIRPGRIFPPLCKDVAGYCLHTRLRAVAQPPQHNHSVSWHRRARHRQPLHLLQCPDGANFVASRH